MYYLYEGGMSAFGSALEFGLKLHPAYSMFAQKCMLEDNEMVLKFFNVYLIKTTMTKIMHLLYSKIIMFC